MHRRLIATIIGVALGAILLTAVVTFALASRAARERTRRQLVVQSSAVAAAIKGEINGGRNAVNLLHILRGPFNDTNDQVLVIGANGRLIDLGPPARTAVLPAGLKATSLHPDRLLAGQVVSGTKGSLVYAAAPYQSKLTLGARQGDPTVTQVVVLTRQANTGLRQAAPWFLLSAALVLLVAVLVADRLGRRISRPLKAAETVTRRIAAGDLGAQIEVPHHSYAELESLAQSINTMAESLARSKGLERQFLLSVSHELRTPLTSIRGFAEAIADGAAPDNIRAAGVIASEARRLERLVRDLLDLAKLDARRFSLDIRRVDLAEVVGDAAEG
ncbi:MAG: HAMP domain-containing histidine kinase, partial [Actinomycetota bacterium]|nr:HAMP domain-containing histidine kinase [Actinomycetota bacterium]